jgi:hypothetical protein
MSGIEAIVPVARLFDFFECDPEVGVLRWKARAATCYRVATWNKRFAGKIAGRANTKGYIQLSIIIDGVKWHTVAHRVIWAMVKGEWHAPDLELDHRNGKVADNRLRNLRPGRPKQNIKNKGLYRNNKSGFKGVCWVGKYSKFGVQIQVNGGSKFGGYYDDPVEAAKAYDCLATQHFGEFARTNLQMGLL